MLTIKRVEVFHDGYLEVELSNGNTLMLRLSSKLRDPAFAALLEDDRIYYPHTDGACVYWRDGPQLKLDELEQLTFRPADAV